MLESICRCHLSLAFSWDRFSLKPCGNNANTQTQKYPTVLELALTWRKDRGKAAHYKESWRKPHKPLEDFLFPIQKMPYSTRTSPYKRSFNHRSGSAFKSIVTFILGLGSWYSYPSFWLWLFQGSLPQRQGSASSFVFSAVVWGILATSCVVPFWLCFCYSKHCEPAGRSPW